MATYNVETDGGTYQVETDDNETSALGAAGRGALDAIPFGLKGAAKAQEAVSGGKYDDYLHELDSLLSSDKNQHPVAHIAGEAAGTVAPFAIPGVGEALGAETVAGRAVGGAGIGALQAASSNRKPEEMGSDILKGAGTGALIGPAAGALGDAAGEWISKAAPGLEESAANNAVKTGGFRPSMLGHMDEGEVNDLGRFMTSNDLVTGDPASRLQKAQVLKQVYGNKIGEMGDAAAKLEDSTPYSDALKEASMKYSSSGSPEAQSLGKTYLGGAQDIENHLPAGSSYKDVQELKEMYGDLAYAPDHTVKNPAAAEVYNTLKQMQKDLVSKSPQEFQDIMKGYSRSADLSDGLRKQLGQARAGGSSIGGRMGMMGMLRQVPGMQNPAIGIPAGIGMAAAGHPYVGVGLGAMSLNNPATKSAMAGGLANMAKAAPEALSKMAPVETNALSKAFKGPNLDHPAMAAYKPVFEHAVHGLAEPAEKEKQVTITDFVLSQRDPNYSKAKQKATEEPSNAF